MERDKDGLFNEFLSVDIWVFCDFIDPFNIFSQNDIFLDENTSILG
jgi:hypothetical protein